MNKHVITGRKNPLTKPVLNLTQNDRETTSVCIRFDRYSDDVDLSSFGWYIRYVNAANEGDVFFAGIPDADHIDDTEIRIDWTLPECMAAALGTASFSAYCVDTDGRRWGTGIFYVQVNAGVDGGQEYTPDGAGVLDDLVASVSAQIHRIDSVNDEQDADISAIKESVDSAFNRSGKILGIFDPFFDEDYEIDCSGVTKPDFFSPEVFLYMVVNKKESVSLTDLYIERQYAGNNERFYVESIGAGWYVAKAAYHGDDGEKYIAHLPAMNKACVSAYAPVFYHGFVQAFENKADRSELVDAAKENGVLVLNYFEVGIGDRLVSAMNDGKYKMFIVKKDGNFYTLNNYRSLPSLGMIVADFTCVYDDGRIESVRLYRQNSTASWSITSSTTKTIISGDLDQTITNNANGAPSSAAVFGVVNAINKTLSDKANASEITRIDASLTKQSQTISDINNALPNKLDRPDNAAVVGKVLKIKAVNEDGSYVVEWAEDEKGIQFSDIPYAKNDGVGVGIISPWTGGGIQMDGANSPLIKIRPADERDIDAKSSLYYPIAPRRVDHAVMSGLTDPKNIVWTAEQQALACQTIGAEPRKGEWVLKGTLTGENKDAGIDIDLLGCTQLLMLGVTNGTGSTFIISPSAYIVGYVSRSGPRTILVLVEDLFDGYVFPVAKYSDDNMGSPNINLSNTYCATNKHISSIRKLTFANPAMITDCNIKIYAR